MLNILQDQAFNTDNCYNGLIYPCPTEQTKFDVNL